MINVGIRKGKLLVPVRFLINGSKLATYPIIAVTSAQPWASAEKMQSGKPI